MLPPAMIRRLASLAVCLLPAFACAEPPGEEMPRPSRSANPSPPEDADARPALVAFGDSLTAGYGIEVEEAWPSRLQELLDAGGFDYRVVNAGVSGETTAGGLRRLGWALDRIPGAEVIVIALGGNDGLRAIPARVMEENLRQLVADAQERGLRVLLAGVPAPPELGADYGERFAEAFRAVAEEAGALLLPSILEGVAGVPELNQSDRVHPNAAGQRRLADNVFEALAPLLGAPPVSRTAPEEPSPRGAVGRSTDIVGGRRTAPNARGRGR